MSIFSDFARLLDGAVGNNLENRAEDVAFMKKRFAHEGRYNKPVENGYIDRELDQAIYGFQRDNNLKIDGRVRERYVMVRQLQYMVNVWLVNLKSNGHPCRIKLRVVE